MNLSRILYAFIAMTIVGASVAAAQNPPAPGGAPTGAQTVKCQKQNGCPKKQQKQAQKQAKQQQKQAKQAQKQGAPTGTVPHPAPSTAT